MHKVFLIGDPHFYHKNIIDYCNRPFSSVDEMNEYLVKRWNSVVSKGDVVICLGDFALGSKDKIIEIGQRLNGRKYLILGNHDQASINTYYEAGFEFVSRFPILYDGFFILSHEPQFVQENGPYANVFAHVHNDPNYKDVSPRGFCVSAERINYTPIEWEEVKKRIAECDAEVNKNDGRN